MQSFEEIELAALRRMTAAQKLAVSESLWRTAWAIKVAGVRMHHPDWSDAQVQDEVRAIFARDAT